MKTVISEDKRQFTIGLDPGDRVWLSVWLSGRDWNFFGSAAGCVSKIPVPSDEEIRTEWARPRADGLLSTKGKVLLVLTLVGLLFGSWFLGRQAAFGFLFQDASELL